MNYTLCNGNERVSMERSASYLADGSRLHWYRIDRVLGAGGFGVTYAGTDLNLQQPIALKEYFPRGYAVRDVDGSVHEAGDADSPIYGWGLARFLEEARTLARMDHPNIVRVHSVFEANGTAYMVMEFESGPNLSQVARTDLLKDEKLLLGVVHSLVYGLEHVHGAGFIHRDIKPQNVVLRPDSTPVLLDFGSARAAIEESAQATRPVLTRGYAPLEQYDAVGCELPQGPWSDIYGLAATLYSLVTGRAPHDALSRWSRVKKDERDPLRRATEACVGAYSPRLLEAIDRGLALFPAERPQSLAQWRALMPARPTGEAGMHAAGLVRAPSQPFAVPERAYVMRQYDRQDAATPGAPAPSPGPAGTRSDAVTRGVGLRVLRQSYNFAGLGVLVVDDDTLMRNLVSHMLRNLGVREVVEADGGAAALAHLSGAGSAPDVILCDLSMPGMDGLELLHKLAESHFAGAVVLLSGADKRVLATAEILAQRQSLYVLGSLHKPFRLHEMAAVLARFEETATALSGAQHEQIGEAELREGLASGALELHYQPQAAVADGRIIAVEALARWRHPRRGLLPAATFVPCAESTGLGATLTDAVLRMAISQAADMRASGLELGVCVNVTMDFLGDPALPDQITALAESRGLEISHLTLDINEGQALCNSVVVTETLARLRLRGVHLAVDDFGRNRWSMEQLQSIPFTEIKIDGALVHGAHDDPTTRSVLESGVELGRRLGLRVVGEGAETLRDWELLSRLGCDALRGFVVARPMPPDLVHDWLEAWTPPL